ncbi:MAG: pseudouridine synthase [Clostridium sp.]|uniref:pseudouridine synthase n=1 Tax=Clostridium sp. TaxID=1506 RepID=UPI00306374CD
MRINKLLSNLGVCSRRETNRLIEDKRVKVNGILCEKGQWVELEDEILIDDAAIQGKEKIYIALNKPIGITCTAASEVKDNIIGFMNYPEYIFPVGRLDKASQGLIIMTNDGELSNKILEAENHCEKEYVVTLDRAFDDKFIKDMSEGVEILGEITRPCIVTRINEDTFRIILTQGLNKQIRRMSKVFGYDVVKLERIRILNLKINGIDVGAWRYLTETEVQDLSK